MNTTYGGSYAPGSWVALTGPRGWMLADLAIEDPLVQRCWAVLSSSGSGHRVLDELVASGLTALPRFALVTMEDDLTRVVVRHPAQVSLDVGDAHRVVRADEGIVWTEELFEERPLSLELSHAGATPASLRLPLGTGVARAEALALSPVTGNTPLTRRAPEPATATAAESTPPPAKDPDLESTSGPWELDASHDYSSLFTATSDRDRILRSLGDPVGEQLEQLVPKVHVDEHPVVSPPTAIWEIEERPEATPAAEDQPASKPSVTPEPPRTSSSGLIDHVPWDVPSGPGSSPTASDGPVIASSPAPASHSRAQPGPTPEHGHSAAETRTVHRSELLKALTAGAGPMVLALTCPLGHPTPVHSPVCRVCGVAVEAQEPVEVPRPALGSLRLDSGDSVTLDKGVLLGRAPEQRQAVPPEQRLNVVRLSTSDEISRNHVQFTLDGWDVLVRDLGSSNGTTLTLPGGSPQLLRPHEDYHVEPGSQITIAEVTTVRFEVDQ